ncbi:hypothetical protein VaNZ11_006952 [Volvox africanus]|uniref:Small-subunit processome Utp21 domain-containing protein n=1 Tax=Volvox africanus TaxID=51714 RepID=A0ABQ5S2P5_9CHLO|nr:hypothetical protein VaNZ11_006952 [Volvox africanus]
MEVVPLFKPFRALGYITDNVPLAVNRLGKETFVTVSVGKAWQVYNCTKLSLSLVGPQLSGDIRGLACASDLTFAAVGSDIVECKRLHRSGVYRGAHAGHVRQLLVLGRLLLSLDGVSEKDSRLVVWEIGKYDEPLRVIEFRGGFQPSCMCHPDTYVNKVLVGSEGGEMQLWNWRTGDLLYCFKGWGVPIRTLASSPALDVVGVGLADGRAVVHNIKFDEEVVSFANAAGTGLGADRLLGGGAGTAAARGGVGGGACTALSFRTGAGLPLMAAGGGGGAVTVWNLEERRLHTVIRDAHDGQLLSLHFFPGEPLLMSSAADNAIKHWVFDSADAMPRLLRFRAGHGAPPTLVRHYGEGGLRLLSGGCDRSFRVFSVHQDQQSRELSQGHIARKAKRLRVRQEDLKLERVVDMDACEVRERDWANVITAHEGDPAAYSWRLVHFSRGEHILMPPLEELSGCPAAAVTSVALSRCGNFGIVGSASGRLDRYNMQSGIHRGAFYRPAGPEGVGGGPEAKAGGGPAAMQQGKAKRNAHNSAVIGCAVDGSNRRLVSVGFDSVLRVWDFRTQSLAAEVALGSPATRLVLHPVSGLAAVALTDASLRLYDIEVPRLVRRFRGHSDRVTGLHISSDSRWLLSSAMDGTMSVWDIPAAQCLQVMKLGSPVTSLSLSPSLDLLATTHVNRRGIYLWSNQALFGDPAAIPHSTLAVPVARIALPTISDGRNTRVRSTTEERDEAEGEEADIDHEDEDGVSSENEDAEMRDVGAGARTAEAVDGRDGGADASRSKPYELRDPVSGAPLPLAPELVTLSLLPRSHWDSLTRIEVIKARNKPLQPPKKPEAAPFFLPSLPGLSANPIVVAAEGQEQSGQGVNQEAADEDMEEAEEAEAGPNSRVIRLKRRGGRRAIGNAAMSGPVSPFVHQLRLAAVAAEAAAVANGGDCGTSSFVDCYGPVISLFRKMTPTAIDRELRAMQILEGSCDEQSEIRDLGALLDMLIASLGARRDFELCQALLNVVLTQQGDVLCSRSELAPRLQRLRGLVAANWQRLDSLMQHVRCMVGFLGNLQA